MSAAASEREPLAFTQVIRFAAAGLLSTAFYFGLFLVLDAATTAPPPLTSGAAYLGAVAFSYLAQALFTFRAPVRDAAQASRFLINSLAGGGVCIASVWAAANLFRVDPVWGAAANCLLAPALSFLIMRNWVFRRRARQSPANAEQT